MLHAVKGTLVDDVTLIATFKCMRAKGTARATRTVVNGALEGRSIALIQLYDVSLSASAILSPRLISSQRQLGGTAKLDTMAGTIGVGSFAFVYVYLPHSHLRFSVRYVPQLAPRKCWSHRGVTRCNQHGCEPQPPGLFMHSRRKRLNLGRSTVKLRVRRAFTKSWDEITYAELSYAAQVAKDEMKVIKWDEKRWMGRFLHLWTCR
jgi:hypothetical protein